MSDSLNRSEQLAVEFFRRVWGPQHDMKAIDEFMTEDYVIHSGGQIIRVREAFKVWVQQFQNQLLEAKTEVLDVFSNTTGDKVITRWVYTGKNNGLLGLPQNGRPVSFTGMAMWHIRDDRLAECWIERSAWELYQELSGE